MKKDEKQLELWQDYETQYYANRKRNEQNEKWLKWEKSYYSYLGKLSNGGIIRVEKSTIQKNFCFGFGMYLNYTDEDYERAEGNAEVARTNAEYFVKENLAGINEKLATLENDEYKTLLCKHSDGFYGIAFIRVWDVERQMQYGKEYLSEPTKEDLETYKEMLLKEKADLEKRLQTYLKKYGLSKLNVWTYLVD